MPMITLKDTSVRLSAETFTAPMIHLMRALLRTAPALHQDTIVLTSVKDGRHSARSLHYAGLAVDVRIQGNRIGGIISPNVQDAANDWAEYLRQVLGVDFDVLNERDHLHIEYDPKA